MLPRPPWGDVFISWLGAFLGILAISGVNQAMLPELHASLLVASFGARLARPALQLRRHACLLFL